MTEGYLRHGLHRRVQECEDDDVQQLVLRHRPDADHHATHVSRPTVAERDEGTHSRAWHRHYDQNINGSRRLLLEMQGARAHQEKLPQTKPRTKPDGATKWRSVHRTTSHSDEECYSQGSVRPNKKVSVSLACASCAHCSSGNSKSTADTTAAAKDNESSDSAKPVINFAGSNNNFDGGFMFTAAATRRVTPSTKGATLLVDSGPSESFLDDELIPGLKKKWEFKELSTPNETTTDGKHTTYGVGIGIISFTIRDSNSRSTSARCLYQASDAASSPQQPS